MNQEAFHTQWYNNTGNAVSGHEKSNKSNNQFSTCVEGHTEDGSEWLQCFICEQWFHKVFFKSLIWLFFIYKIRKFWWNGVFNINLHQHIQNYPRKLFYLFIYSVKSPPVFPIFSVRRNKHKFVIYLTVKVFTDNILIEYSVVHPAWILKHDYSTKIETLFFLDFYSVRHFRPTFYLVVQIICNNFWFVRFLYLNKCSE